MDAGPSLRESAVFLGDDVSTVLVLVFALITLAMPLVILAGIACRIRRAERRAMRWRPGRDSLVPEPDSRPALLVFGAQATAEGPSRELAARLDHALLLQRRGVASLILVSGGMDGPLDEVACMSAYLRARGAPADAVLPCRPGGNTRETLKAVVRFASEQRLGPFIAVSTPYHACRVEEEARRRGLQLMVSAPDDTPEMQNRKVYRVRFCSEILGVLWYALPESWSRRLPAINMVLRHRLPLVLAGRLPIGSLWDRSSDPGETGVNP